jgi:hypothetical protein
VVFASQAVTTPPVRLLLLEEEKHARVSRPIARRAGSHAVPIIQNVSRWHPSDGRQRRVLPLVQTHANDYASRMSTAHTRRSRHLRLVYARHACCVAASAGVYLERLVKHDGV